MFCSNCGNEVPDNAVICMQCGCALKSGSQFSGGTPPYDNTGDPVVDGFDWLVTLLLCIFLGTLGIHRFYTRSIGIGIVQLLTLGGCGIWCIIDLITIITGSYRDGFNRALVRRNGI